MALSVGLNRVDPSHYGPIDDLVACEFDANDMAEIGRKNGFEVKTLLTGAATRNAVIGEIRRAAAALNSGDIFMLSYSGHGGQVDDVTGEETDRKDETWCLFDGELIDDELYALWTEFRPEVRILVFSDSCHSGTAVRVREYEEARPRAPEGPTPAAARVAPPRFRAMPADLASQVASNHRDMYGRLQRDIETKLKAPVEATVLLISGCQDNQLSLDGNQNGLFTGTLKAVYGNGFSGNYRRFHETILSRMPFSQSPNYFLTGQPNPLFEAQNPFKI
jgi:hypothetical protein